MVLIVTNSTDATADLVEQELLRRCVRYFRLNTDRFPMEMVGTAKFARGFRSLELVADEKTRIDHAEINAVWYRRPVPTSIAASVIDPAVRKFAADEAYEFLRGFWLSLNSKCHWISHPEAIRIAERKLVQLDLASKSGFVLPRTVVTNSPEEVLRLRDECPGGVVVKVCRNFHPQKASVGRVWPGADGVSKSVI